MLRVRARPVMSGESGPEPGHAGRKRIRLREGRAEECMASVRDASVDLVIADPPYDIGVGGVKWDKVDDYMGFARAWLGQCVRALRPAGALLLYGSPCRTWVDRMTLLLVDELGMRHVQDMPWVYTQGSQLSNSIALVHSHTPTCLLCIF